MAGEAMRQASMSRVSGAGKLKPRSTSDSGLCRPRLAIVIVRARNGLEGSRVWGFGRILRLTSFFC